MSLVSVMGFAGAVIHYAPIIVELARRDGPEKSLEVARTGFLPEGEGYGHLAMRMYLWEELEAAARSSRRGRRAARPRASSHISRSTSRRSASSSRSSRSGSRTTPAPAAAASTSSASCASREPMAQPSLARLSIPDRFAIDEPFVARRLEDRDVPIVAPAFSDPGIGGENGMPPFDEDELHAVVRDLIPKLQERGVLFPYVIEDTENGSIVGASRCATSIRCAE